MKRQCHRKKDGEVEHGKRNADTLFFFILFFYINLNWKGVHVVQVVVQSIVVINAQIDLLVVKGWCNIQDGKYGVVDVE